MNFSLSCMGHEISAEEAEIFGKHFTSHGFCYILTKIIMNHPIFSHSFLLIEIYCDVQCVNRGRF